MAPPNTQPILPAEGIKTDLEQVFIGEQPQRLFPENQNSNFGTLRKILVDEIQQGLDLLTALVSESYISTASGYLSRWEGLLGLPKAPQGYSDTARKTLLLSRRTRGLFTRTRRRMVVERFISATFGTASDFTPDGLSLASGGITLFSGENSLTGLYAIVEDIPNFHYQVRIKNTISPDTAGLTRELTWMTPAHLSFDIVSVPVP